MKRSHLVGFCVTLLIAAWVVLVFTVIAYGAPVGQAGPIIRPSTPLAFPVVPDGTPVIGAESASCDNGVDFTKTTYDTDPGGPGGVAVFRRSDDQSVFAVIVYSGDHPMGEAYILENGTVQRMTVQELQGRYARPCDIITGLRT